MRVSVSEVLDWTRCQQAWSYKHVERWAKPAGEAFEDGTFWHLMSAWTLGPLATGVQTPLIERPIAAGPVQDEMAQWIREGNLHEQLVNGWEIEWLEQPMAMPLGGHTLLGTPDGGVKNRVTGARYNLQWKTCAANQSLDALMDKVRVSWHECAYERMTGAAGTLLGVWKKRTKKQAAEGLAPFVLVPLTRGEGEVARALEEIARHLDDMELAFKFPDSGRRVVRNRGACVWMNARCQYFGVCHGGVELGTAGGYVEVGERYAPGGGEGPGGAGVASAV